MPKASTSTPSGLEQNSLKSTNTSRSRASTTTSSSPSTTTSTTSSTPTSSSASGNGTSTVSGPRRFRGDVPAFNPSVPHLYTQQMQQQQQQSQNQQSYNHQSHLNHLSHNHQNHQSHQNNHHHQSHHSHSQNPYSPHLRLSQYYTQPYVYNPPMMQYYPMTMGYPDYSMYQPQFPYYHPNQFHNQGYVNMTGVANVGGVGSVSGVSHVNGMGGGPSSGYYAAPGSSSSINSSNRRRYQKDSYHDYHSPETLSSDFVSTPTPTPAESIPSTGKQDEFLRLDQNDQKYIDSSNSGAKSRQDLLSNNDHKGKEGKEIKEVKEVNEDIKQETKRSEDIDVNESKNAIGAVDAEIADNTKTSTPAKITLDDTSESETNLKDSNSPQNEILPLLFHLSMDEFLADHEISTAFNKKLIAIKTKNFEKFLASEQKNYAINTNGMEFIQNFKTGARYYKRIIESGEGKENTNETNEPFSAATATNQTASATTSSSSSNSPAAAAAGIASTSAPLAWSAVLQASGVKPKKQGSDSQGNGSLTTNASAIKIPQNKNNASLEPMDVPQSLGLLMMQYLFDPSFKQERYDINSQKPRGLTNSGNICYMNVILQCLIFCEPFTSLFHLTESKSIANIGAESPTPLIDATIHFLKDYVTIPALKNPGSSSSSSFNSDGIVVGKPLSPEPFYQKLIENSKFQHLSWGQQEDAEEFLGYFLDGLHEEFVKVEASIPLDQMERISESFSRKSELTLAATALKASILKAARLVRSSGSEHIEESEVVHDMDSTNDWAEVGSGRRVCKKRIVEVEPSPITRMFGGRFRSVLTVPKGKEQQSITLDPFRCILLDITQDDVKNVEDALWKFNEVEKIPYKVDMGKEVIARKQTFIDELPEILILHMKRFSYQNKQSTQTNGFGGGNESGFEGLTPDIGYGTIEKVMKNILYGLNLTIPLESLSAPLRRENGNNYFLTAVIYHHGRNAEGGHYTCDVMRPGKRWLRIDDTAVEAIDADDVLDTSERDKSAYILMYQKKTV